MRTKKSIPESNWSWRGLDVIKWEFISFNDMVNTPQNILKTLASAKLPVKVLEDQIFRPELGGIWEGIEINGSIKLFVKSIDPKSTKRSKHHAIVLDGKNNFSVGLPVLA
ncbi:MAG: hypothetical protein PHY72_04360 [Candidatus Pacebacteria bacterium]|nr:hypothetical protein [Candidatus Paceibacterota bacterium]